MPPHPMSFTYSIESGEMPTPISIKELVVPRERQLGHAGHILSRSKARDSIHGILITDHSQSLCYQTLVSIHGQL